MLETGPFHLELVPCGGGRRSGGTSPLHRPAEHNRIDELEFAIPCGLRAWQAWPLRCPDREGERHLRAATTANGICERR
jgi:hypothetical protein